MVLSAYRFNVLTVERPAPALRALLRAHSYRYVLDHGCFGDQLWIHSSLTSQAEGVLGVTLPDPTLDPHKNVRCIDLVGGKGVAPLVASEKAAWREAVRS